MLLDYRFSVNETIFSFRSVRKYFSKIKSFIDIPLVKFSYAFVSNLYYLVVTTWPHSAVDRSIFVIVNYSVMGKIVFRKIVLYFKKEHTILFSILKIRLKTIL